MYSTVFTKYFPTLFSVRTGKFITVECINITDILSASTDTQTRARTYVQDIICSESDHGTANCLDLHERQPAQFLINADIINEVGTEINNQRSET